MNLSFIFGSAKKPAEPAPNLEAGGERPVAYSDRMQTISNQLRDLKAHFEDLASLKKWENLQPTVRARDLGRWLAGYQGAPTQKTLETIPGYSWTSGAYTKENFDKVINCFQEDIEKAKRVYEEIIGFYSNLNEEQKRNQENLALITLARETFRTIALSVTGLHNWKVKLSTYFEGEEIEYRHGRINELMRIEQSAINEIFENTLKRFQDVESLFKLSEAIRLETVDFTKESPEECFEKIAHNNIQLISRLQGASLKALEQHQFALAAAGTKLSPEDSEKLIDAIMWTAESVKKSLKTAADKIDLENLSQDTVDDYFDSLQTAYNFQSGLMKNEGAIVASLEGEQGEWIRQIIEEISNVVEEGRGLLDKIIEKKPAEMADIPQLKLFEEFTKEDGMARLDAYLIAFGPNLPIKRVRKMIAEGKEICASIIRGILISPEEHQLGKDYVMIRLTWFLMSMAIKKGQGHSSGSIVIEDHYNSLFKFLDGSKSSYVRTSSHFHGRGKMNAAGSEQKGIDLPRGLGPVGKGHLLFAQVDSYEWAVKEHSAPEKVLFVKLEFYGTNVSRNGGFDVAMHGWEYVKGQVEKKIHKGADDAVWMAKERVPHNLLKAFEETYNAIAKDPVFFARLKEALPHFNGNVKKEAQKWGVSYIHRFSVEVGERFQQLSEGSANADEIFAKWSSIQQNMPVSPSGQLPHMEKRTGKEVYLSYDDIRNFALAK